MFDANNSERTLTMSMMVSPEQANFIGNMHGGHLLRFLDQVAFACGAQYTGKEVLTLSVDHVFFKQAVHISNIVSCHANINFIGRTSMEIGIRTEAKDWKTGEVRHVLSCFFTMVAVDDSAKPVEIKSFTPATDLEKRRWNEAEQRRELRQKMHKK
jgi:acyl-CoA hydrolase